MRRSCLLFLLLIFLGLLNACMGAANQETQPPVSSTPTSPEIFPTDTSLPSETPLVMETEMPAASPEPSPTFTSTAISIVLPTLTPTVGAPHTFQLPDPELFDWQLTVSGLRSPVGLANSKDGSGRLFVVEQSGRIRVVKDDELLAEPFLDISEQVSCCGERGLLGLAFHPQYSQNGLFFVNYTGLEGGTVIARFETSADNPDQADPASEFRLLGVEQPYPNHNGGGIAFGPDGYLYIALGDGGSGGDPHGNAQNASSLLGKLLRLDVNQAEGYAIPPDNPFAAGSGAPEVWTYGLRNPWRFSFDSLTGDLFIGDVGQNSWEEIDYLPAGYSGAANFGWNYREGAHSYGSDTSSVDEELIDPVAEYGRDQGYSVVGGLVYRGEQLPEWYGVYLYGDYGSGNIWGLLAGQDGSWVNQLLFQTASSITAFGEDEQGELYYVDYSGGLYQLVNK